MAGDKFQKVAAGQPLLPGDPVIVYNTGEKKAFTGSLGWAISINGQLWVVGVNQYALLSLATLSSDTHGLSPGSGTVGDVADQRPISLSSLTAVSTYPHSFIPSPLPTLTNPHNLLAKSGDQATVVYNETVDQWQIGVTRIWHDGDQLPNQIPWNGDNDDPQTKSD